MSRQLWREDYYKVLGVPRNASQKESQLKMSLLVTKLLLFKDDKLHLHMCSRYNLTDLN
jgi:hypothetical protein